MHATDENHPEAAVPTDAPYRHVLVDIAEMVVDTGQPSNGCERAVMRVRASKLGG